MNRPVLFLIILFLAACKTAPPQPAIRISLINNKQSLKITGIDAAIMHDIARDTASDWQTLFAVYHMPADTDLKNYQPVQPGKYQLNDSVLVFTPDTPFVARQTYFMRYNNYAGDDNLWHYVQGKNKPGKIHYTDFTFKQ